MDDVHLAVDDLAELHAVIDGHAPRQPILGAEAELQDHVVAAGVAQSFQHLQREAGSVLHASAIFVGPGVEERRDELLEEKPVSTMQKDAVKARRHHKAGGPGDVARDLVHHRFIHGEDLDPVFPGERDRTVRMVGRFHLGVRDVVAELHHGDGAMLLDPVRVFPETLEVAALVFGIVNGNVDQAIAFFRVDRHLTGGHSGGAPLRPALHHREHAFFESLEESGSREHRRAGDDAVTVDAITNRDRAE